MKNRLLFILILVSGNLLAQSGYLGKKNFIELKLRSVPSYKHMNIIDGDDAIRRLRLMNSNYSFSVSRVFARNFEISATYEFARIVCMSDYYLFENEDTNWVSPDDFHTMDYYQNYLDDPEMISHGAAFSFCFYRLGSLAPIGKYIGFSLSYNVASFKEGEQITVGQRGLLEKDGFFKSVGPIGDMDVLNLPDESRYSAIILKAKIGRNYPITNNLMINCGMSFPVLSQFKSGNNTQFGFSLEKSYTLTETTSWRYYAFNSMRFYNRVSVELGIRYHF